MAEDRSIAEFHGRETGARDPTPRRSAKHSCTLSRVGGAFPAKYLEHDRIPQSEYFLLALRDHFYLWHRPAREPGNPDFEADTASELHLICRGSNTRSIRSTRAALTLLIQAWLGELVDGTLPESEWLVESGLAAAVRDGSIRLNLAA